MKMWVFTGGGGGWGMGLTPPPPPPLLKGAGPEKGKR